MNSLTSNNTLRRGMGIIAIIAIITITFVFIPQAVAAGKTDRGPSRAQDGQTIDRAPGDNDNIGGARYKIFSDTNEFGECGGGSAGTMNGETNTTDNTRVLWWTKVNLLRVLILLSM